jgi:hypothetical protein
MVEGNQRVREVWGGGGGILEECLLRLTCGLPSFSSKKALQDR